MGPRSRRRELAGGALCSSPGPEKKLPGIVCLSRRIEIFLLCILHTGDPLFFHHTPGQRPPHVTSHCVNTATLGWVGAPNERNPLRVDDPVVGFVDRYLLRARNRALQLNIRLSFSEADVGPRSAPELFFSGFSKSLGLSVPRNVLKASLL